MASVKNDVPAEYVAGGVDRHPIASAALIGGSASGAALGPRALARRTAGDRGQPINSVMANAITASDVKP